MTGDLTPKQAKFVQVYLSNGQKAGEAYRAVYNTTMPMARCSMEASKLLRNPKIAPYIAKAAAKADAAIERAAERYAVSRERNVSELARIAYANLEDFTRLVGEERVVDLSKATRDQLAAVQEIVVEDYLDGRGANARQVRRTKFKLADKQGAIERLNRMFGWIIDKSEIGRPGEFANLTDEQLEQALVDQMVGRGMEEGQARALLATRRGSPGSGSA
jgi:phage terminase small subunit